MFSVSEELPAAFWDSLAFRLAVFSSESLQIGWSFKVKSRPSYTATSQTYNDVTSVFQHVPESLNDDGAKQDEESREDQRYDGHHLSPGGDRELKLSVEVFYSKESALYTTHLIIPRLCDVTLQSFIQSSN